MVQLYIVKIYYALKEASRKTSCTGRIGYN